MGVRSLLGAANLSSRTFVAALFRVNQLRDAAIRVIMPLSERRTAIVVSRDPTFVCSVSLLRPQI